EPFAKPTVVPFKSATDWMDESFGTKIPLPLYLDLPATTYVKGASEACAKMGGVHFLFSQSQYYPHLMPQLKQDRLGILSIQLYIHESVSVLQVYLMILK